eukprot:6469366-Amphidinium_carterae.2
MLGYAVSLLSSHVAMKGQLCRLPTVCLELRRDGGDHFQRVGEAKNPGQLVCSCNIGGAVLPVSSPRIMTWSPVYV